MTSREAKFSTYKWAPERTRMSKYNVLYKRAGHISERATSYHLATTILYCYTTTLGTNYNYI